jgi:hypothetical protein
MSEDAQRVPCPSCPWRRSTPAGGFPGGIIDAMSLVRMVGGGAHEPVMQCHCTPDTSPEICVGFALQVGGDAMSYRLAVIAGVVDPKQLTTDEPLHTLGSLLRKHGGRPHGARQRRARP